MEIALKIKIINEIIEKCANNRLREMDLTMSQHHAMAYLMCREGHTAPLKEMEKRFRVAQATMAGIVLRLEAKQYVQAYQDPNDRRVKMVRLTPKGEALCEQSFAEMKAGQAHMLRGLTDEEKNDLHRLLDKIYENLQADTHNAAYDGRLKGRDNANT